jgi:hypothetical protein
MSSQIALILLNLLIAGVIFSHLALTTPVIFKTLDEDAASSSSVQFFQGTISYYFYYHCLPF